MNQYRDFDNDQNTFSYSEGETFLSNLHTGGRHYIPIIDSAIYVVSNDFLLNISCFGYYRRFAVRLAASMSKTYIHLRTRYS